MFKIPVNNIQIRKVNFILNSSTHQFLGTFLLMIKFNLSHLDIQNKTKITSINLTRYYENNQMLGAASFTMAEKLSDIEDYLYIYSIHLDNNMISFYQKDTNLSEEENSKI